MKVIICYRSGNDKFILDGVKDFEIFVDRKYSSNRRYLQIEYNFLDRLNDFELPEFLKGSYRIHSSDDEPSCPHAIDISIIWPDQIHTFPRFRYEEIRTFSNWVHIGGSYETV